MLQDFVIYANFSHNMPRNLKGNHNSKILSIVSVRAKCLQCMYLYFVSDHRNALQKSIRRENMSHINLDTDSVLESFQNNNSN